ncbi:VWA domain-containing protein [bacterium]|nr:VWA domain-containing protein [bacterium]
MKWSHIFIWIIFVHLLFVSETFAQDETPPGVDMVFIVDQSGSMNYGAIVRNDDPRCIAGQSDCPRLPPTDPDELAIVGLKDAVNPIVNQIFRRSIERDRIGLVKEDHNFGVILFGSDAATTVAIPLTRVEIQQDEANNITSNVDTLIPPKAGRNFGDTDFDVAFREACAMLTCNVPVPNGRKRVVVVFTDGQPSGANRSDPTPYYQALFSRHQSLFDTATIWVIGLDRQDEFWSANRPFWEQIAPGQTFRVTNPQDISAKFREISSLSIGETDFGEFRNCDNSDFLVEPYLETLTLVLEYPNPDSKARFIDSSGSEITLEENVSRRVGFQTEYYIISKPLPGTWRCEIVGESAVPRFTDLKGAFQFAEMRVEETGDLLASTCRDFQLAVSYLDGERNLIAELPEYPLRHTLTVSIPDNIQTRPLIRDGGRFDRWVTDGPLSPDTVGGDYPVGVTVQLASTGNQLFADTDIIRIDPNLPCIGAISIPQQGARISMHQMLSLLPMRFEVVLTQGGQPSTPDSSVFGEPLADILVAHVSGPNDYQENVQLTPDPNKRAGVFVGQIDTPPEVAGAYTFTVSLQGTTANSSVYVLPPQESTFTRVVGAVVQGIEVGSRVAAGLGFILLLAALGLFAYRISPPYPRGTLQFERKNTGVLAGGREWEPVGSAIHPARHKWLGVFRTRSVTIKKGLPRTEDLKIRRVKIMDGSVGKSRGVRVEIFVEGNKTSPPMNFTSGKQTQTQPLAGNSKYRLVYEAPPK